MPWHGIVADAVHRPRWAAEHNRLAHHEVAFAVFQKPEPVGSWRSDRIIQSWDTALTDGKSSDYSACITFLVRGNTYYILDVLRKKLNYPDLRRAIYHNWMAWGAQDIIIEEKASGISLIRDLRGDKFAGMPRPIAFKPEGC